MRDNRKPVGQRLRRAGRNGRPLYLSPLRALLLMVAVIFLAEVTDMYLLERLGPFPQPVEAIIDASFLLVMLSPAYFLLYRPSHRHWEERQRRQRSGTSPGS